ncbi:MAG: hypothetical protein QOG06_1498, partial [Gaiellaceae bacterium]|nr:hypothetical protein [Gaiellaceae bacterium]
LEPLLEGIRIANRADAELASRLEVVFAGALTEDEHRLLDAPDLADVVRYVGWLQRPRALELQRGADTLLVITEGTGRRSVATGKVFEYLAAGRPILVLGEETEAARIVAETASGSAVSAGDPHAIADALRRVIAEPPQLPPANAARDYAYPVLVERLAGLIDRVRR